MNILKHFLTIGISSVINIIISLFTTPIITRIVNPADYGQFNMFTTHVGIVSSFLYLGLNDSLYRFFYTYDDKNKKELVKLCVLFPLAISIISSFVAMILFKNDLINADYSFIIFVLLLANVVLTVWNSLSTEILQNTQNSKVYSIASFLQKFIYSVSAVCMLIAFKNNHLLTLVLATTASLFISSFIATYSTKQYWSIKAKLPKNTKEIINYSIPMYIYFIIYTVYDSFDRLLIDEMCSDYDVGIYTSAFAIVGIFAIVQTAFTIVWRPLQTEHYTNHPDDTDFIKKGNTYMTIIMFFLGINIIIFKDLLCLFLGENYREAANIIPFLIFNPIMNTLIGTVTSGIEYSKKSYLRFIIIVISLISEYILGLLLIPKYGIKGASVSLALSLIIQYLLTIYFSNKHYYIDYGTNKISILLLSTLIFAYINCFYNVLAINIIGYILLIGVFYLVYKNEIVDMFMYFKKSLFNKSK